MDQQMSSFTNETWSLIYKYRVPTMFLINIFSWGYNNGNCEYNVPLSGFIGTSSKSLNFLISLGPNFQVSNGTGSKSLKLLIYFRPNLQAINGTGSN